jgi:pyruvate,orthophosphate dikinase
MYAYLFGKSSSVPKMLLGYKGTILSELESLGVLVPLGFVVTTEACNDFLSHGRKFPKGLHEEILDKVKAIEAKIRLLVNSPQRPLLLSVRSSPPASMPEVADAVLNLGLNDEKVGEYISSTGNDFFAYDAYRRLIQTFGHSVFGIKTEKFQRIIDSYRERQKGKDLDKSDAVVLRSIVADLKKLIRKETGREFPQDLQSQMQMAVTAVFDSWNKSEAILYRKTNRILGVGTGVIIQAMVFGNLNKYCGTGLCFTRHPATGKSDLFGQFLVNSQGKDNVAGIRLPESIRVLENKLPQVRKQLVKICKVLERHFGDMQEFDFVMEDKRIFVLSTRAGRRSSTAAVRIAVKMAQEGLVSVEQALLLVHPSCIERLTYRRVDPKCGASPVATGLPGSPGAVTGKIVFDIDEAIELRNRGEDIILVRTETVPEDIRGIMSAQGMLTSKGGMTSHATVTARGMGKPAVVGCEQIKIDASNQYAKIGDTIIRKGQTITIDGANGTVFLGAMPIIEPGLDSSARLLLKWADKIRKLQVRANVDTPRDARRARKLGSDGVGLCRSEEMLYINNCLGLMRELVFPQDVRNRTRVSKRLQRLYKKNFKRIFREMQQLPVAIRLLDLPLYELLSESGRTRSGTRFFGYQQNEGSGTLYSKQSSNLLERNPMLGHRGCRLAISHPEVYEMQVRAIFEAAGELQREGLQVQVEIMLPFVGEVNEIHYLRNLLESVAASKMKAMKTVIDYKVGTMIEIPRAALTADELAKYVDFFSFGTNDLTQMTFAYSRDDAEATFLKDYLEKDILAFDPFVILDRKGVGKLVRFAVESAKATNGKLKIGLCGEHGGEPNSIEFCSDLGFNYVSCPLHRVPLARLVAAQVVAREKERTKHL